MVEESEFPIAGLDAQGKATEQEVEAEQEVVVVGRHRAAALAFQLSPSPLA